MVCKCITIFIFLSFFCFVSYSQVDNTKKTSSTIKQESEKEKFEKEQAVFLLKNILLKSKSIENFQQKTYVIIEAAVTLWDYDKPFARESLLDFIDQSFADYQELLSTNNRTSEENNKLQDLSITLNKSLKALAGKDLEKAKLLQNKFFEIKQQNLKGKELDERLELVSEGLELDEKRTLDLLTAILQQGVPSEFPKLISTLKEKNPDIAEALLQRAMQNLAVNPNYQSSDAIYLSIAVFNEEGILIPSTKDETNPNNFFVFTSFIGKSNQPTTKEKISNYFSAVQNFFNSRLQNQANGFFDSLPNLIGSYFLIEKLKSYNQIYGLANSEGLNSISITIAALMQTAGFNQQTLSDVKGYAQRLTNSNNPLGLDDGKDLLEKAENAKNADEKLDYLISGIIRLIELKQYEKAERKIFDIESVEIRDSLNLLLNVRSGMEAIKLQNWRAFEKRVEKISENRIQAFMYLKAISAFKSQKDNNLLSEYTLKSEKNIKAVPDKSAKANAYFYLTDLLLSIDKTTGILTLPNAIKAINEASDFNEDEFEINIKIPTRKTYFAEYIGANSFKNTFSKLAEIDWNDSQVQALQIKSKGLQALAQVATAKEVLRKTRK